MKKMRIIITESQYKKLISNENYNLLINEAPIPTNLLDDLISLVSKTAKKSTKSVMTSELKNAFGLGVRSNLDNLTSKLNSIKEAGEFLSPEQLKILYSSFYSNQPLRKSFESFFIKDKNLSTLLRGYRKAKLENNVRMMNRSLSDLSKFIPDAYIDDVVSKLPTEDYYKLTKELDFNDLKSAIKSKLKKDGKLDKKTIDDYLETNEVKKLQLDPKEQQEITNLINSKSPQTFEFINLVKKHNPTSDGPFYEYLMDKGYITKENYATALKIYGAKTLLFTEDIFKKIGTYYSKNPIKGSLLTILFSGLVTGTIFLKDIIKILSEWGWIKIGGYVKKDESYIINKVREFLNSEKPMIGGSFIKNIPGNQLEGQEISVINPTTGSIVLDPGISIKPGGELITYFIWDDESKKLTPKTIVKPKTNVVSTTNTFENTLDGFKLWYTTPTDKGGYGSKFESDETPSGEKDSFIISTDGEPFLKFNFKDGKFEGGNL